MHKIKEFKIYSTPTCGYCHMLKDWLTEKNIPYTDIDVAADPAQGAQMVQKSGQMGVPVSIVTFEDEKQNPEAVVLGFDQDKIAQILGIT
ncbi:MAG: glutaredoxin domain-containing protein [Patescibacteria group bacterium]|nr:glutaredoxin domain-containing protein [Patescibacteria group bacterium]